MSSSSTIAPEHDTGHAFGRAPAEAPTPAEIEAVDAGRDQDLVDAAFEPLDEDPLIRSHQADRERHAYRGDFAAARVAHQQVLDLRGTQALADRRARQLEQAEVER